METKKAFELDLIGPAYREQNAATENALIEPASELPGEAQQVQPRSKFRMAMILVALYMSLFVAALDVTIVATATPTITADLHSAVGYIWIGGAYLIANAAAAPIWVKF